MQAIALRRYLGKNNRRHRKGSILISPIRLRPEETTSVPPIRTPRNVSKAPQEFTQKAPKKGTVSRTQDNRQWQKPPKNPNKNRIAMEETLNGITLGKRACYLLTQIFLLENKTNTKFLLRCR